MTAQALEQSPPVEAVGDVPLASGALPLAWPPIALGGP
jgi:hypothetical protein